MSHQITAHATLALIQNDLQYKVVIHEKVKVDGRYVHIIEIIYNFVEAIDLPDFDENLQEAI